MIIPYNSNNLFKVNREFKIVYRDDRIIIIDDWYERYEEIYQILNYTPVDVWKWCKETRNLLDYYDCRGIFPSHNKFILEDSINTIQKIVLDNFNARIVARNKEEVWFNYFKNKVRNLSNNLQHLPHIDFAYTSLVYMDKICNGGTAFYNIPPPENTEHINLMYDISGIEKIFLPAKPNRMVIFKGDMTHGGYIEDHNLYIDNWRINQVMFFKYE